MLVLDDVEAVEQRRLFGRRDLELLQLPLTVRELKRQIFRPTCIVKSPTRRGRMARIDGRLTVLRQVDRIATVAS